VYGIQFDVVLPSGALIFDEKPFRLSDKFRQMAFTSSAINSSTLRVLIYSLTGETIAPDSTWLGEVVIKRPDSLPSASYGELKLMQLIMGDHNNKNIASGAWGIWLNLCKGNEALQADPSATICGYSDLRTSAGEALAWYRNDTLLNLLSQASLRVQQGGLYRAIIRHNGCVYLSNEVQMLSGVVPAAPGVSDTAYCQGDQAVALTCVADAGNQALWYTAAVGGTGSTVAPVPTTATVGTQSYYVTQQHPSGCESPRSAISVTVKAVPEVPVVSWDGVKLKTAVQANVTYQWVMKEANLPGAVQAEVLPPYPSRFRVKVTKATGCAKTSDPFILTDFRAGAFVSIGNGDWNSAAVWQGDVVPAADSHVIVEHQVQITTNTSCKKVEVKPPGQLRVAAGKTLLIKP
jgi:hypothetical protein